MNVAILNAKKVCFAEVAGGSHRPNYNFKFACERVVVGIMASAAGSEQHVEHDCPAARHVSNRALLCTPHVLHHAAILLWLRPTNMTFTMFISHFTLLTEREM